MSDSDIRPGQIDPITFEVLRNAFMSVVDEMGADARARRPLARRQRGPRLQRRHLRRRRPHDRGGQGRPARARRHAAVHGQGRHRVGRQGADPRGRHLHHERRLHRRHALPGRAHDHARVPRRRADRVRAELGALVGRRRPRARQLPRRGGVDLRRGALHHADPPRARGRAGRGGHALHPAQRARARHDAGRRVRADRLLPHRRGAPAEPDRQVRPRADQVARWTS